MWRPTRYGEADFAAFREAVGATKIAATTIHAVYLVNCASNEAEIRDKSINSLTHALRTGDGIDARGVVLHAGARKGEPHEPSMKRAAKAIGAALAESEACPVLLENTAGMDGPLGRNFDELARLLDLLGGDPRVAVCLDCCHLLASGFEIRTPEALDEVLAEFDEKIGLDRLRCLHLNDSKIPLGGNRDRHAILGTGEIGERGLAVFLSEPRFAALPTLIETGADNGAPALSDVQLARKLRKRGLAARRRGKARAKRA